MEEVGFLEERRRGLGLLGLGLGFWEVGAKNWSDDMADSVVSFLRSPPLSLSLQKVSGEINSSSSKFLFF